MHALKRKLFKLKELSIIRRGDVKECYEFACNNSGVNVKSLGEVVLICGDAYDNYMFCA